MKQQYLTTKELNKTKIFHRRIILGDKISQKKMLILNGITCMKSKIR